MIDLARPPTGPRQTLPTDGLLARAALLAGIGAWSCDLPSETLTWTPGVYDLFGLPHDRPLDRRETVAMYDEESRAALERVRSQAIAQQRGFTLDARIIRPDGENRWVRLTAELVCRDGRPVQLYGMKQDITAEHDRFETMRQMAEHDPLTGLSSRAVFEDRFLNAPAGMPRIGPLAALVLFDVDGFKLINDRYGHAAGDACLQAMAARLATAFPDAVMIARIGGDEFAVLIGGGSPLEPVEDRVARYLQGLSLPTLWRGHALAFSASAGIAAVPDPFACDAEMLFADADAALYAAKRAGRNRVRASG